MIFTRPVHDTPYLTSQDWVCQDVDAFGNPDFQKLFWMFQKAANDQAEALGIGHQLYDEKGLVYVLVREKTHFYKPFIKGMTYTIITYPRVGSALELPREAYILDSEDNLIAIIDTLWVLFNLARRRIVLAKPVNDIFDNIDEVKANEPVFEERLFRLEELPVGDTSGFTYKVKADDIDGNGHMNNTRYFSMIQTQGFQGPVEGLEINYEKECFLDEVLTVYPIPTEKGLCYQGYHQDGSLCFELDVIFRS